MNKLFKNFSTNKRTVEAMMSWCSYYGCSCDPGGDCACGSNVQLQDSQYKSWTTDLDRGYRKADF